MAPLLNKRLIFRYFTYKRNAFPIRRFLDWGSRSARALGPPLILALYFRFVLAAQIARAWQVHKPFIIFNSHWGPKIRMIRPRNRAALTRSTIRHVYFAWCPHVWRIRSHDHIRGLYCGGLTKLHLRQFSEWKKAQRGVRSTVCLF